MNQWSWVSSRPYSVERASDASLRKVQRPPAIFEVHTDEIELIISDVVMPGTNGPTLCAELLAKRPDLPVIYVTGFVNDPVLADSLNDSDRQRLVEKPFTLSKLLRAIEAMLSTPDRATALQQEPGERQPQPGT